MAAGKIPAAIFHAQINYQHICRMQLFISQINVLSGQPQPPCPAGLCGGSG
jgi:hypothetical protein